MPTRVVIRQPSPTPESEPHHHHEAHDSITGGDNSVSSDLIKRNTKTPIRGVVGFRSSCRDGRGDTAAAAAKPKKAGLSSMDLRASPRLQGYLFMLVASIVNLVTVAWFLANRNKVNEIRRSLQDTSNNETEIIDEDEADNPSYTEIASGDIVLTWKLYGALVVSALGVFISFLVVMVHFDFVCYPLLWKAIFRDGSKVELYFLIFMFFFWAAGLHICTSTFSVGVVAPNVYFTTWTAFATVPVNINVWRKGAGQHTLADRLYAHHRETMHNWFYVFIFTAILALAIADLFANRNEVEYLFDGEVQEIPLFIWRRGLCIAFASWGLSIITIVCDHYLTGSRTLKFCGCKLKLEWRQAEGLIALYLVGVSYWMIVEYTGVNFPLNGPSNAYFGAWGVFFSSIFTFGTWLHENKDTIEILTHHGEAEEQSRSNNNNGANNEASKKSSVNPFGRFTRKH